ncbi:sensor histidine kinase [Hymenobacter properus]|uniref:Histidine kinase n=1 Tax=Hymenobacter properus TaxID=2791026 RepID=A0A931BM16_9BACT|nr:histidine kinase [Hymenobacter properus]MBF9141925.1 histidine kinase [Hymenobacter properus]MBR7720733.1 histidine kinase [Microvirga sp. SRT04]
MQTARLSWLGRFRFRQHWHRVLVLPWAVPLTCHLLVGPAYLSRPVSFVGATLLMALLVDRWFWGLNRATSAVVQRYPDLHQTGRRVVANVLVCLTVSACFLVATVALFSYLHLFGTTISVEEFFSTAKVVPRTQEWVSRTLGISLKPTLVPLLFYAFDLVVLLLVVLMYEAFYLLGQWQASKINFEQRRKASLQGQLQSLKNQVNPHFLFNTLNSLSSLIADEPRRAEEFVDEMANVYRYLLQTNEQELTPLAVELAFIQSYFHLLKTRHGSGLHLRIRVKEEFLGHRLPPLTLQMLVENAVKHNVIQTHKPLLIDIATTPAGGLRVRNNTQPKNTRVDSNHVGLANIAARYQLLAQAMPLVKADAEHFTVTVPLLAPAT